MEHVFRILLLLGKLVLFVALSIIFLPSFFVVQYLQKTWTGLMSELFNY